jgi:hypothetical protein
MAIIHDNIEPLLFYIKEKIIEASLYVFDYPTQNLKFRKKKIFKSIKW